jgi:hypothetical protein
VISCWPFPKIKSLERTCLYSRLFRFVAGSSSPHNHILMTQLTFFCMESARRSWKKYWTMFTKNLYTLMKETCTSCSQHLTNYVCLTFVNSAATSLRTSWTPRIVSASCFLPGNGYLFSVMTFHVTKLKKCQRDLWIPFFANHILAV